jgi:hypothetical protein
MKPTIKPKNTKYYHLPLGSRLKPLIFLVWDPEGTPRTQKAEIDRAVGLLRSD